MPETREPIPETRALAASPMRESPAAWPARTVLGYSVQNRPIELLRFGSGQRPVLIMGGIHGDETSGVYVVDQLAQHLRRNPEIWSKTSIAIITFANPDGYAAKTRVNARGVDLNRNFPADNWRVGRAKRWNYGGSEPLSEPESRAMKSALDTLSPRLLVSLHSIGDGKQCNNFDGPAESIARAMSACNGYPPAATIGYPTPGSLGSYAGIDRKIPMITLELPKSLPNAPAWENNREALLTAIRLASGL